MAKREHSEDTRGVQLPSGRVAEIQEVTGAAEKILTRDPGASINKKVNKFILKALVALDDKPLPENPGEAYDLMLDMKTGDRNYLLTIIRMATYGDEVVFNYKCPNCGKTSGYLLNLRERLDDGTIKVYPFRKDVPLRIETSAGVAEVDYMNCRREQWLNEQKEVDPINLVMAFCTSFDGKAPDYKTFENLYAKDLNKIRLAGTGLKGGLDPNIELDCLKCGISYDAPLFSIQDFFTPLTTPESIGL